jgi:hypothetical protein
MAANTRKARQTFSEEIRIRHARTDEARARTIRATERADMDAEWLRSLSELKRLIHPRSLDRIEKRAVTLPQLCRNPLDTSRRLSARDRQEVEEAFRQLGEARTARLWQYAQTHYQEEMECRN